MGDPSDKAVVLVLAEGRYFCRFGRNGQVLTAWSLAGAHLFGFRKIDNPDLTDAERRLTQRGKAFRRVTVGLLDAQSLDQAPA